VNGTFLTMLERTIIILMLILIILSISTVEVLS